MKTIGLIGIGWLGGEVAKYLVNRGIFAFGTTTTNEKLQKIENDYSQIINYRLGQRVEDLLFNRTIDIFMITIPPSSIQSIDEIKKMIQFLKSEHKNAKFIYTSSTSIYGSEAREVDEQSMIKPETKNAKKMAEIERFLLKNYTADSVILRLAGLVGGERHPIKYLAGRNNLMKPKAVVNLVHREDVISLVYSIIKGFEAGVYNLSCPDHPTREVYYGWAAEQKKIAKVVFQMKDKNLDKVVNCNTIKRLNFKFKYNSPYDFPM